MKTRLLWLIPMIVAPIYGQENTRYDTTINLMAPALLINRIDSFYIHPYGKYLHIGAAITASCPGHRFVDFDKYISPEFEAKVACISTTCWEALVTVSGLSCVGPGYSNKFSFANRYYKWSLDSADIYFRILDISDNYDAKVQFSPVPFSTGIIKRQPVKKSGALKSHLMFKGMRVRANGVLVESRGM